MKTILVQKYQHSTGYQVFALNTLGLKDKHIGAGAFGEVYECTSINEKAIPVSLAVKVLFVSSQKKAPETYKTVLQLQERMKYYEVQKLGKSLNTIQALQGLPSVSFEGELNGRKIYGYITKFFKAPDWVGFHRLFDEEDLQKRKQLKARFYQKSNEEKLQYAKQLVEGFKVLRLMSFIHADLNPHNIFINLKKAALVVIDYDSGAITNEGSSEAETFGKLGDWLAPEIRNQLLRNGNGKVKVNLYTDAWSVAVGIHALFFWAHPLFYLKSQGKVDMTDYYKRFRYPEVEMVYKNFRKEYEAAYHKYLSFLNRLPPELFEAFQLSFNVGFHTPANRISYSQWSKILGFKPQLPPNSQTKKKKLNGKPTKKVKPTFPKIKLPSFSINLTGLQKALSVSKNTAKNIWRLIFKPPEIKELKKKILVLEQSKKKLFKEVGALNLQVEKLSKEKNSLSGVTQNLEKKNIRLMDSQQNLLAERNTLLKENTSHKRDIDKLTREVKFLQSKKWLGENSKKVILLLILVSLISWIFILFSLFGK